ncbi:MAG: Brp/Blh family beta-carotene 15,15'-dioxygenase [Schleiferiaceae bacterium]|nr:Brp/Blh family beta-carotene 15,15'-dioxygenase [Schleiferiaceae bacterium]MDR9441238.1 Brp/Blh family beta-carotene 15,15'-dioxygenase [Schleiferiaceae bacterium]
MEKSKTRWSLLQSPQGRLWLLLGLSLLALLGEQWAPGFSRPVLYSLLGVGLLTVGLGHGAMDQITTARARQLPLGAFIGLYLGVMALMALFWWLWAYGALVVFLLYSALHFGETDLRSMGPHHWGWHLLWGSLLLLMILSGHADALAPLWPALTGYSLPAGPYQTLAWGAAGGGLLLALYLREKRLAGLTALLVLGYGLPLLMAFGLYFIGQHSVQGWLDLHRSLRRSHRALLREAAPYTLGAWLGLAGALYWSGGALAQYTAALFVFISCVSLPHVVLMAAFYRGR